MFTSVGIRNMATMRHSLDRMDVCPVEERFIQMSAEGLYLHLYQAPYLNVTVTMQVCYGVQTSQFRIPH